MSDSKQSENLERKRKTPEEVGSPAPSKRHKSEVSEEKLAIFRKRALRLISLIFQQLKQTYPPVPSNEVNSEPQLQSSFSNKNEDAINKMKSLLSNQTSEQRNESNPSAPRRKVQRPTSEGLRHRNEMSRLRIFRHLTRLKEQIRRLTSTHTTVTPITATKFYLSKNAVNTPPFHVQTPSTLTPEAQSDFLQSPTAGTNNQLMSCPLSLDMPPSSSSITTTASKIPKIRISRTNIGDQMLVQPGRTENKGLGLTDDECFNERIIEPIAVDSPKTFVGLDVNTTRNEGVATTKISTDVTAVSMKSTGQEEIRCETCNKLIAKSSWSAHISGKKHLKALKQKESMEAVTTPTSNSDTVVNGQKKKMFGVEGPLHATPSHFFEILQAKVKHRLSQKMRGDYIDAIRFDSVMDIPNKETTCTICNLKIKLHINEICAHLLGKNHIRRMMQRQQEHVGQLDFGDENKKCEEQPRDWRKELQELNEMRRQNVLQNQPERNYLEELSAVDRRCAPYQMQQTVQTPLLLQESQPQTSLQETPQLQSSQTTTATSQPTPLQQPQQDPQTQSVATSVTSTVNQ